MNRHERRARQACREGAARVPRKVFQRRATDKEVAEVAVAYKIVQRLIFEHKKELRDVPPAAVASVLLDAACMFLAGAHLTGESIDWDRVRYAMRESFADHLNKLRQKKHEDQTALRGEEERPPAGPAGSERED